MNRRGTLKFALVAMLAASLSSCCAFQNKGAAASGANGPTLRAGFVRVSKNNTSNVVAFYSNDKNNVAIQYWATAPGGLPIQAMAGDTLYYEFINQPLAQDPMDMCNNLAVRSKFPTCEVTTVTVTQGAATMCPPIN